jgi:ectoine hydroxylase-related dioxygenase (phytanoyl-CoA dioxygenase family)
MPPPAAAARGRGGDDARMLSRFAPGAPHAEIQAALDQDGAVILTDRAAPALLDAIARELAPWLDRPIDDSPLHRNAFTGLRTLRTSALVAKSPGCRALVMDPDVLALVEAVLGPQCARVQLSFTQAIRIGPGEAAQVTHRDSTMYPFRRPGPEVFVNAIWALTDFTAETGATRIHPGSHRWEREPGPDDHDTAAEMPRGSVVVYLGSVWHGGGANTTADRDRTGLAFGYTLGWLRQEENQYLACPPEVARTLPIELQRLLGYADHYPFLGWSEGADAELLHGGAFRKRYATEIAGGAALSFSALKPPR